MKPAALIEQAVVISPRMAAYLEHRLELATLRKRVRGKDREVDDVLLAIRVASSSWLASAGDEIASGSCGSQDAEAPEVGASSMVMSASDVATQLGITDRRVRQAADAGALIGTKNGRGWWSFTPTQVASWDATRPKEHP